MRRSWQASKLTSCQTGKMTKEQDDNMTWCEADKVVEWWHAKSWQKLTKVVNSFQKMTMSWWRDHIMKWCQADKFSSLKLCKLCALFDFYNYLQIIYSLTDSQGQTQDMLAQAKYKSNAAQIEFKFTFAALATEIWPGYLLYYRAM